jgi:hypothetical protein
VDPIHCLEPKKKKEKKKEEEEADVGHPNKLLIKMGLFNHVVFELTCLITDQFEPVSPTYFATYFQQKKQRVLLLYNQCIKGVFSPPSLTS